MVSPCFEWSTRKTLAFNDRKRFFHFSTKFFFFGIFLPAYWYYNQHVFFVLLKSLSFFLFNFKMISVIKVCFSFTNMRTEQDKVIYNTLYLIILEISCQNGDQRKYNCDKYWNTFKHFLTFKLDSIFQKFLVYGFLSRFFYDRWEYYKTFPCFKCSILQRQTYPNSKGNMPRAWGTDCHSRIK